MSKKIFTDYDFGGVSRPMGIPVATAAGQAVPFEQLSSAIEGLAWKDSVRAASTANINLASPGANIDGVAMSANDRFLAKNQTAPEENGIYVWNGAAVAATRATDASTFAELEGAVVTVEEGTANADTNFRQTEVNGTIGTDPVAWTTLGSSAPAASETVAGILEIATQAETNAGADDGRAVTPAKLAAWSGRALRYFSNVGDGSNTSLAFNHNLGTRDVQVQVFRNASPWDTIDCDVERTTANQVTLTFATAPAIDAYRVVILA